jgi:hypothetical protein
MIKHTCICERCGKEEDLKIIDYATSKVNGNNYNIYDIPTNNLGVKEFLAEKGTAYFCITSVRNENVTFSHTSYSSLNEYDEISSMFIE